MQIKPGIGEFVRQERSGVIGQVKRRPCLQDGERRRRIQSRQDGNGRPLHDDDASDLGQPGRVQVRVPVKSRCLARESRYVRRIVELRFIPLIRGSPARVCDLRFKCEHLSGDIRGVFPLRQGEKLDHVLSVGFTQVTRVRSEVHAAVERSQAGLAEIDCVTIVIAAVRFDSELEQGSLEAAIGGPHEPRQFGARIHLSNRPERVLQGRRAERFESRLVHERGVVSADLRPLGGGHGAAVRRRFLEQGPNLGRRG